MDEVNYKLAHDSANAEMLPAKSKSKKSRNKGSKLDARGRAIVPKQNAKKLTKKKKKELEKIVERKEKKSQRADLYAELLQYQVESKEFIQSKLDEEAKESPTDDGSSKAKRKLNSIKGSANSRNENSANTSGTVGQHYTTDEDSSSEDDEVKPDVSSVDQPEETSFVMDSSQDDVILVSSPAAKLPKLKIEEEAAADLIVDELEPTTSSSSATTTAASDSNSKILAPNSKSKILAPKTISKPALLNRSAEIQDSRLKLPILAEEQPIVEAINENPVVIICGETGSGKTTQVPQFLFEAGYTSDNRLIGITEPRRVAAISMAQRVGTEMNLGSDIVSYQIRFEGNATADTQIKFMTDGVLLKEMQRDIMLSRYSVIIIDEAHERSLYSDILIGLLSRIAPMRHKNGDPLKLVIMSATLRVDDFTQPHLFSTQPVVINVESRQFPVSIYFNRRTTQNYLTEAYRKVTKIHRALPEGAILVFVSGQQEVHSLIKWLQFTFPFRNAVKAETNDNDLSVGEPKSKRRRRKRGQKVNLDDYDTKPPTQSTSATTGAASASSHDLNELGAMDDLEMFDDGLDMCEEAEPGAESFDEELNRVREASTGIQPLYCLPLYSLLPTNKQQRVFQNERFWDGSNGMQQPLHFLPLYSLPTYRQERAFQPPPPGTRLCIVSTNVAETSLTIPGVKYVVDTGKEKRRRRDPVTGVSQFVVDWVSQASANQRAGRAGRTSAGHTYRLYSSAVFNDEFAKFADPDIANKPAEELVLQMKSMNIVKVANFPFPSAPPAESLIEAERKLERLGLLDRAADGLCRINQLGRTVSLFAVLPQFGKVLTLANQHGLLPYAVAVVAALSVREPFQHLHVDKAQSSEQQQQQLRDKLTKFVQLRKQWTSDGQARLLGDITVLLKAVGAVEYEGVSAESCNKFGLRYKAVVELRKLRKQLTDILNANCDLEEPLTVDAHMPPPTDLQAKLLRQILLSGLADQVAIRAVLVPGADDADPKAYRTTTMEANVHLHPTSVLCRLQPDFVLYQELIETDKEGRHNQMFMHTVCAIEPAWLPVFAEKHCNFGETIVDKEPWYDVESDGVKVLVKTTFGQAGWPISPAARPHPNDMNLYRYFACALLEGRVFNQLQPFRSKLLTSPSTLLKTWARSQSRIEALVTRLANRHVASRAALTAIWTDASALANREFLYAELCAWLPESSHDELLLNWPPTQ